MFIHGSVIQKCQHGIYLASPEEVKADLARYCGLCTPDMDERETARTWDPTVQANPALKKVYDATACPKCGSETHSIQGRFWICSECENQFRPPRGLRSCRAIASIRRIEC
jgi:hypothetical protein